MQNTQDHGMFARFMKNISRPIEDQLSDEEHDFDCRCESCEYRRDIPELVGARATKARLNPDGDTYRDNEEDR